jgi:general secretion pathway protein H
MSRAEHGFTLLEMLLVLALLAVMATLAMPFVQRQTTQTGLKATALQLTSLMRIARAAAIRDSTEKILVIDANGRRFWVDGLTRAYAIANEIRSAPSQRMRFFADGSATGGKTTLSSGGTTAEIELDMLTGQPCVRWRR